MNPTDRLNLAQLIGQMLIADGNLDDNERAHFESVMDALGMDAAEKKRAISGIDVDSPVEERVAALAPEAKQNLLSELEAAMHTSGHVEPGERLLLDRVAELLGN